MTRWSHLKGCGGGWYTGPLLSAAALKVATRLEAQVPYCTLPCLHMSIPPPPPYLITPPLRVSASPKIYFGG
jgi:hypothetical protein